jgi:hypothetical protein
MTPSEIIEMAKQAGCEYENEWGNYEFCIEDLEAFAKLVAAKEREAFIALCKTYLEASEKANNGVSPVVTMVIEDCIKRIELRGMV